MSAKGKESAKKSSLSFSTRVKDDKPITIKLDNIRVLTGQSNYNIWAASMKLVWKGMKVYEIVVDGAEPSDDAVDAEKSAYESLCHQAAAVYIQVVSQDILKKIVELDHPHRMWESLRGEFYRDTAFALVSQIMSLVSLPSSYDPEKPISTFIASFEQEWLRLNQLAKSSSDTYRQLFSKFLDEDKAKRNFLLGFLVRHQKNVVDNLSTKDNFTFAEVKQRLLDLDHEQPSSSVSSSPQTALLTTQRRNARSPRQSSSPSSQSASRQQKPKECTWCVKHNLGKHLGHTWSQCFKLKKHQEEQKSSDKGKERDTAMVTTDSDNGEDVSNTSRNVPDL
ncbi:hypothetical protein P167DRAFT_550474 [Morchella conica CCBAS932]|uniref:DUF4219 domain-containing protein n=1 Tax=Morchella conica CCBAS932 TaxID=1392247 RepID=A0A3N4K7I9_9PEZI|nr:hypothetical protein P167DRAFT_550474 [Morchella conica CCBAS932]